jgi:hypothetical protein
MTRFVVRASRLLRNGRLVVLQIIIDGCHAHACRGHVVSFSAILMPTTSVGMAPKEVKFCLSNHYWNLSFDGLYY